ncbi:MAG: Gx transporter family protein [Lachnospiraceae bacterium]|nr:Gx transporter family protein [Lachnospiraceae bacterium]
MQIKKISTLSALLTLSLICSYIESLIPFYFGVPGMKLGLTNLVIVFLLYSYSFKEALAVNVARILLTGFLFGNLFGILYSLAGALLSLVMMALIQRTKKFSVIGVSVCGGVTHNIGQLLMAMMIVENYRVSFYLPVLIVAGCLMGALIGIAANEVIRRVHVT